MSHQTLLARLIFCMSVLFVASECAADFPTKPIQLVVPYGAGPGDSLARIVSICMAPRLKQPVLVVNKPGANAVLGAKFVITSPPDGHTIILAASATVTDLVTSQNPAFDVRTELEPITKLGSGVQGVYVNSTLPIQTIAELVNYAKARPGQLNYATAGVGSVNHVSTEAFSTTTGIKMTHVPFPGGTGPFLSAMMGGVIEVAMTDLGGAQAALDSGKIRLIGVMSKERLQSRPNVPTVIESFPSMAPYLGTLWFGFFAPPKTPKDILAILNTEIVTCLNEPTTRASLKKFGYEDSQIIANTPEQFRTSILEDIARLRDIVQRANIQLR